MNRENIKFVLGDSDLSPDEKEKKISTYKKIREEWEWISGSSGDLMYTVFFEVFPDYSGAGFEFYGFEVEIVVFNGVPEIHAVEVMNGSALFDGVRHIYFRDRYYQYYPSLDINVGIMKTLGDLERRYCGEHMDDDRLLD